jgi:hypothetical protein
MGAVHEKFEKKERCGAVRKFVRELSGARGGASGGGAAPELFINV